MVVTKKKVLNWILLVVCVWAGRLQAMGLDSVKFLLNYFSQDSDSGDQVYDNSGKEDVTAFELTVFIAASVDEETDIKANFVLDSWTAASDTAIDGLAFSILLHALKNYAQMVFFDTCTTHFYLFKSSNT